MSAPVRQSVDRQETEGSLVDGTPLVGCGREAANGDIVGLIALDVTTGGLQWQTDGKRLWDEPAPSFFEGSTPSGTRS